MYIGGQSQFEAPQLVRALRSSNILPVNLVSHCSVFSKDIQITCRVHKSGYWMSNDERKRIMRLLTQ